MGDEYPVTLRVGELVVWLSELQASTSDRGDPDEPDSTEQCTITLL